MGNETFYWDGPGKDKTLTSFARNIYLCSGHYNKQLFCILLFGYFLGLDLIIEDLI